ncbi:hypothetical protein ACRAWF_21310 [Streptomyces sp. L7]
MGALSGGNQQKVLLAGRLQTEPVACFLEDPTNGVDIAAMADIHTLVDDLASRGVAVLARLSPPPPRRSCASPTGRQRVVSAGRTVAEHDIDAITHDELVATALGGQPQ